MMRPVLLTILLSVSPWALSARAAALSDTEAVLSHPKPASNKTVKPQQFASNCFPLGTAVFNGMQQPDVSRAQWWCPPAQQYGFLGFSYPLEATDCNDPSNQMAQINADFARMKHQFNATMVRIYAPQCRDASIWRTLLQAGVQNNMAILPQVWWGFDADQTLWKKTAASIISVLNDPDLGPIAPYVFHSIAFGSEPIGDFVDGGPDQFSADLKAFKASVQPFGIPVTISEDWDRPGTMSGSSGSGLGPVGKQIAPVIDLLHVHIMPYYHADRYPTAANVWSYFQSYIPFLESALPGKQIIISQTMWSSVLHGSHDRGFGNPGENIGNFTQYWNTFQYTSCAYFQQHKVGYFVHTYDDAQEYGMGMLDSNMVTKMYYKPLISCPRL